jgi:quinol monooxygenase YgiN
MDENRWIRPDDAVVSVLVLQPKPGCLDELARRFAELRVAELSIELTGCQSVSLLRPLTQPGQLLVIARWPSTEALAAWNAHPTRAALAAQVSDLIQDGLEPTLAASVFEIASHVDGADSGSVGPDGH